MTPVVGVAAGVVVTGDADDRDRAAGRQARGEGAALAAVLGAAPGNHARMRGKTNLYPPVAAIRWGGYWAAGAVTTVGGSAVAGSGGNGMRTTVMLSRPPESLANLAR